MTNETPLIIIIDHEENLCWVVQRILEREGYRVMIAKDGTKALALIGEHQPDMVLLDFMLPDIAGRNCAVGFVRFPFAVSSISLRLPTLNWQDK